MPNSCWLPEPGNSNSDRLRWFDGESWTEHFFPPSTPSMVDDADAPPPPWEVEPPSADWYPLPWDTEAECFYDGDVWRTKGIQSLRGGSQSPESGDDFGLLPDVLLGIAALLLGALGLAFLISSGSSNPDYFETFETIAGESVRIECFRDQADRVLTLPLTEDAQNRADRACLLLWERNQSTQGTYTYGGALLLGIGLMLGIILIRRILQRRETSS